MSMEELANVKGRGWEDIDVSNAETPTVRVETHVLMVTLALNRDVEIEFSAACRYESSRIANLANIELFRLIHVESIPIPANEDLDHERIERLRIQLSRAAQ